MLRIEVLPAEYGDALWIEYGAKSSPRRILIDCGTPSVFKSALEERIQALPEGKREFELFVVSHIDADHIGGAVNLLKRREQMGVELKEVWFNGYKHLTDVLGPYQGEQLTTEIVKQKLPWNTRFDKGPVVVPETGALPVHSFDGGMKLTLLSPYAKQLADLAPVWAREVKKAGLVPGELLEEEEEDEGDDTLGGKPDIAGLAGSDFKEDKAPANGSSIAFLAEYDGKKVLFGADAHAPVLLRSLPRLPGNGPLKLDAFKVSHHGSTHNVNRELLQALRCKNYLISTNGKKFKHPSTEAIARIISFGGGTLHFNYRTAFNKMWDDKALKKKHKYATLYPAREGIALNLD
jgi:beta-lactamase superfamily II metal-dependent hydrolase